MLSQLGIQTSGGKQFFSASGTFTPTFTGTVYVSIVDGGQGCTTSAGGASGKVVFRVPVAVTQGSPVAVTCGTAGASGGGAGGASSFGAQTATAGVSHPAFGGIPGNVPAFQPFGSGAYAIGAAAAGLPGAVLVEW